MKKTYITALFLAQCFALSAQQIHIGSLRTNMPKLSTTTVTVPVAAAAASQADAPVSRALAATHRGVGYCVGDSITTKDVGFGKAGTYRIGADLTADRLGAYKGCKVVGIRFAVSRPIGKTNVYVYKVANDGASPVVQTSIRNTSEGWNEVYFNSLQEITLNGDERLIYCFDYNETQAMVNNDKGAICFYGDEQSVMPGGALIMQNDGFYSITNGNLCIQLIIDISSLPKKDVVLTTLMAGNKYQKPGSEINAFIGYSNIGLEDISSLRLGYRFDDGEATYIDCNDNVKVNAAGSAQENIIVPTSLPAGPHKLSVFVDKIEGKTPVNTHGDKIENNYVVYTKSLEHQKTYVEQYCSQNSPYAGFVNPGMDAAAKAGNVCLVNVYKNGEPLAVDGASYLENLYAYTYPCFTVNRFYFFGENYIAYDANDFAAILPNLVQESVEQLTNEVRQSNPAFATVNVTSTYSPDTHQVTLDVTGDVTDEAKTIYGDIGLTLMAVENGVKAKQVVADILGNVDTDNNYVHNNVLRAYITDPKGDRMNVVGGKYSKRYTYTVPTQYNADNMIVLATVGKYASKIDASNVMDFDITNAATVKLTGGVSGITYVKADGTSTAADGIYTINGTRVNNATAKGIYIVRKDGVARKVVVK